MIVMKRFSLRLLWAAGLFLLLLGVTSPISVQAQGQCLSGHGSVTASTTKFTVHAGDVVTATMRSTDPSDPVGLIVFLDTTLATGAAGIGSASAIYTVTSTDHVW